MADYGAEMLCDDQVTLSRHEKLPHPPHIAVVSGAC